MRRPDGETATWTAPRARTPPTTHLRACSPVRAGQALMALRARAAGLTPAELRDQGDRLSHLLLTEALARLRPGDAVLSEEGADDRSRLELPARLGDRPPRRDPRVRRGGTDRLGRPRRPGRGGRPGGGGGQPAGARPGGHHRGSRRRGRPRPAGPLRLVVSRSHTPPEAAQIAAHLGAVMVRMGSAGAKTMAVVLGEADAYVHLGRPVRVGFGGTCRGRARRRPPGHPHRRRAAPLQPARPLAARSGGLPPRDPRGRPRGGARRTSAVA